MKSKKIVMRLSKKETHIHIQLAVPEDNQLGIDANTSTALSLKLLYRAIQAGQIDVSEAATYPTTELVEARAQLQVIQVEIDSPSIH